MKPAAWKYAACLLALTAMPIAAAPLATVTILDGEAVLVRDATRLSLSEGVRLSKDDIVETTPKSRLLRLEFGDGVIADLGPQSLALVSPRFTGERARVPAKLHLLRGIVKFTAAKTPTAAAFTSPLLDVASVARSAVFVIEPNEAFAFAESGEVALQERRAGKAAGSAVLKGSEFFSRTGDDKAVIGPRPTQAFIQRLPRPFLDTLPARAELFKAREAAPRPLGEITYAQAEPWIDAEGLRSQFVARWKALAQNPDFRQGLNANLKAHPEWDRILNPEKYLPKPVASEPARPAARP